MLEIFRHSRNKKLPFVEKIANLTMQVGLVVFWLIQSSNLAKAGELSQTATQMIETLPKEYKDTAYKLVEKRKFNFTPAGSLTAKSDLNKLVSDLSLARQSSFPMLTGLNSFEYKSYETIISRLFDPTDAKDWLRKGNEKRTYNEEELKKYNDGIISAGNTYKAKIKEGGSWDKEITKNNLKSGVFQDFQDLFNYGISKIPKELQNREVYRRLFVASISLAEYKNSTNQNEEILPTVATQVGEYISITSQEQTTEKLYVSGESTYRLPSDSDIKKIPNLQYFLGISTKALEVLLEKNSDNLLDDLSKLPTPSLPSSGAKSPSGGETGNLSNSFPKVPFIPAPIGGIPNGQTPTSGGQQPIGTTGGTSLPTYPYGTSSPLSPIASDPQTGGKIGQIVTGAGTALGTGELLKLLTEKRKEQEDKIKTAQNKIDELDAESQALVTERDTLYQKITAERNAIGRELSNYSNQCSVITSSAESMKRFPDTTQSGLDRIDSASSSIARTTSNIEKHVETRIGYETRINEINSKIIANNNEITKQQEVISDAGVELAKLK